jgi:hypothetical protein
LIAGGEPAVVMTHSIAGPYGWKLLEQYGDYVAKIVAVVPGSGRSGYVTYDDLTGETVVAGADGRPGWAHVFAQAGYRVVIPDWPGGGGRAE